MYKIEIEKNTCIKRFEVLDFGTDKEVWSYRKARKYDLDNNSFKSVVGWHLEQTVPNQKTLSISNREYNYKNIKSKHLNRFLHNHIL